VNGSCDGNDMELMGEHVSLEYVEQKFFHLSILQFSIRFRFITGLVGYSIWAQTKKRHGHVVYARSMTSTTT